MRIQPVLAFSMALLILGSGCGGKGKSGEPEARGEAAAGAGQKAAPAPGSAGAVISEARAAMNAGNVDDAAAKLAQLRIQGASFDAHQAKDYRQALSEAYDQAVEGARRGDPKAQAALQLLRAAGPR